GAHDGARADARSRLTGIALCTGVAVVAGRGVVRVHASARRVARIVGARIAIVTIQGRAAHADPATARVAGRARVAIVTRTRGGPVLAAGAGITGVGRAGVAVVTVRGWAALAVARGALISRRAGVAVGAGEGIVCVHAPLIRIAGVGGARIGVVARRGAV